MNRLRFNLISGSSSVLLALSLPYWASAAVVASPSFDCRKVKDSSIEKMICADDELAKLDRKLAEVYNAASKRAVNEHPLVLTAEQRGWVKGRNECWKSDDKRRCIEENYRRRSANP